MHLILPSWKQIHYRCQRWAIACLLLLIGVSITIGVQANSPAPPNLTWFEFEGLPTPLDSVQILGCYTEDCAEADLIAQDGECTEAGCLHPSQRLSNDFTCRGKTCLLSAGLNPNTPELPPYFRLLIQSGDRLWASQVITESVFPDFGSTYWLVIPTETEWHLIPNPSPRTGEQWTLFVQGLFTTLMTEATIVGFILGVLKVDRMVWVRTFVSFGLMQTVTYPLVWSFTFALIPFQYAINRAFGWVCVAIALLYATVLYPVRRAAAWKLIVGTLVVLPIGFVLGGMVALVWGYGEYMPGVTGLPYSAALGISEAIVIIYEAGFLAMLSRGNLSLKTTGWMSVWMNGASLAIGLLLWNRW